MMKRITIAFVASLLICSGIATAQTKQADSSIVYVAGEGTNITLGKLDAAKFNLLTTVQAGGQFTRLDSTSTIANSSRLSVNLVRMAFSGSVLQNKVSFKIVTDFTGVTPILEGWVGFNFKDKKSHLILGQKQTNTNNRLAMEDERYAQVMGQSLAGKSNDGTVYGGLMQNFVGSTREGGLFFDTKFNAGSLKLYPSVSITTGEGQNFFSSQPNLGFKYGGRLDVLPLGDFIKNNAFIAHDIYYEKKPKLAVGFAASYNVKASSPIGSDNAIITGVYNKSGVQDYANYRKIVADLIFKHRGFAFVGEYINGSVYGKDLFTNAGATSQLTPQTASNIYNLGNAVNIQASYVFKSKWVVDGRYTKITPEFNTATSIVHNQDWYTFGINKYLKYNAVKMGLNGTYLLDNVTNAKKWIINLALQVQL
jgi:hypothetical protein